MCCVLCLGTLVREEGGCLVTGADGELDDGGAQVAEQQEGRELAISPFFEESSTRGRESLTQ